MIALLFLSSCGKELPIIEKALTYSIEKTTVFGMEMYIIKGIINDSLNLDQTKSYIIEGKLVVSSEGSLSIDAGTRIYASPSVTSYLLIERGSKIIAKGSMDKPIVFTSLNTLSNSASYGDWGGIHINGQAIVNERSASLTLEVGKYGRLENEINDDNSGILSYVRIEFAGQKIGTSEGALNLNGVGDKTQVDHIQTYFCNGNGFRLRGGTVNISHIISTQTRGNGIRWDNGWNGKGQFIIAHLTSPLPDTITLMTGGSSSVGNIPISNPIMSNVTLIGRADMAVRGLRLGEGTQGNIFNMIIKNTERALRADNAFDDIITRKLVVKNSLLFDNNINYFENSTSSAGIFADPEFMNSYDAISMQDYIGSTTVKAVDPTQIYASFELGNYIGAVKDIQNDWTLNWTKL